MYWVGIDVDVDDDENLNEFNAYYANVHSKEVVAKNSGFKSAVRFELAVADIRGIPGPRFLAAYQIESRDGVQAYLDRNTGPGAQPPTYSPGPESWERHRSQRCRTMWRQLATYGSTSDALSSMYIVGIDPPPDASEADLEEFNDFYSNIHIEEIVHKHGFLRATRYECEHAIVRQPEGTPRFLAVYESPKVDLRVDSVGGPDLSVGPVCWQRHETLWRHIYRRI